MILRSFADGARRVLGAPAIFAGVFVLTFMMALPLALTLRGMLESHLGNSLAAGAAADGVNYDWWQEFQAQAAGLGTTFTPSAIGFAAVLDNISSVADAQGKTAPIAGALTAYLLVWTFLAGGIIDRYARARPTRAHGFFAASGVFFLRFLRLGAAAGVVYGALFLYVHDWLFQDLLGAATRDLDAERVAFWWRLALYVVFAALLIGANLVFDYAKIRAVVEDRRSMAGALLAAARFVARHGRRVFGLYMLNVLAFVGLIAVWAAAAPGAGGAGLSMWAGFAAGQLYLLARMALKLQFLASQTALFQASLAHAAYAAAPAPVWPDSPAADTIAPVS